MSGKRMTFAEFMAAQEVGPDEIGSPKFEKWRLWHEEKFLPGLLSVENQKAHSGDCTRESSPCSLCVLESSLSGYREYFFSGVMPE